MRLRDSGPVRAVVRRRRMLCVLLAALVAANLLFFLAVPPLARRLAESKLGERLSRSVSIDRIRVNPYTLGVEVHGLYVLEPAGDEVFLHCDRLLATLNIFSIFRLAPVVGRLEIAGPYVRIVREKESLYNFSDLLPGRPAGKKKPFRFLVGNIAIGDGRIVFDDRPKKRIHFVRKLRIALPFVSNLPSLVNRYTAPSFSAEVNGTPFTLEGKTKPFADSLETYFDIGIRNLPLPEYAGYAPAPLPFRLASGTLAGDVRLSYIQEKRGASSLVLRGRLGLSDLEMTETSRAPLLALDDITVGISSLEPFAGRMDLAEVAVAAPRVTLVRGAGGALNIAALLPAPSAPETAGRRETPFLFDIRKVSLSGGTVSFADTSLPQPFRTVLEAVALDAAGVSNRKDAEGSFRFAAGTTLKETLRLEGTLSLDPMRSGGTLEIGNVPLAAYAPYYADRILFDIADGRASVSGGYAYAREKEGFTFSFPGLSLALKKLRADRRGGGTFLEIPSLVATGADLDVTERKLSVAQCRVDGVSLRTVRTGGGKLDFLPLVPEGPRPTTLSPARNAGSKPQTPFIFDVSDFSMTGGSVSFADESLGAPFAAQVKPITVTAAGLSNRKGAAARVRLSAETGAGETLRLSGTLGLDPLGSRGTVEAAGFPPARYAPYYADKVLFDIPAGQVSLSGGYAYAKTDAGSALSFSEVSLAVSGLKADRRGGGTFLEVPSLTVSGAGVDVTGRKLAVGRCRTDGVSLRAVRRKDGTFDILPLVPASPKGAAPAGTKSGGEWTITVGDAEIAGASVALRDESPAEPVTFTAERLAARGAGLAPGTGARSPISCSFLLNGKGTVSANGHLAHKPLSGTFSLEAAGLPIVPAQPYVAERLNIVVTGGSLSSRGTLTFSAADGGKTAAVYEGDASVDEFRSMDKEYGDPFVAWRSLALKRLAVGVNPDRTAVGEVSVDDLRANAVVRPDKTINLLAAVKREEPAPSPGSKRPTPPAAAAAERPVRIDRVVVRNGRIGFLDRSIEPNYAVTVSELAGSVAGMSSREKEPAAVSLTARLPGESAVSVTGKIQPLAGDLFLDMEASVEGLDLTPASPYAEKYLGYTAHKGRLSLNLDYLIEKRKLRSQNAFTLDQFTLGERVESPTATKLPVKFAVALLRDTSGKIRIDMPVSGSLDDPKFRIGPVIVQMFINLIAKAAVSPFALLGALFGGGEELSYVEFDPGSSLVGPDARKKLDTVARMLKERPGLTIEAQGRTDPARDPAGLRQASLMRKVRAQQLRETSRKEGQPGASEETGLTPQEYERYLWLAYREEKFPKQRTLIGMVKQLPVAEMEKLMLEHAAVTDDDLRLLAVARGESAKAVLLAAGVAADRIFLLEPARGAANAAGYCRVDFRLK